MQCGCGGRESRGHSTARVIVPTAVATSERFNGPPEPEVPRGPHHHVPTAPVGLRMQQVAAGALEAKALQ